MNLPGLSSLGAAATIVHKILLPTPQICWPLLCERLSAEVWLKHENHTPVGSFKVRGSLVYINELVQKHPNVSGVITATKGNHGQSVALAAKQHGLRVVVVVPKGNSLEKNRAMRAFGAELLEHGEDFQDALEYATTSARSGDLHFVPSWCPALVRGVASYTLELLSAVSNLDILYVPIGLGSGICGAIAARDAMGSKAEIVGVVAANAPAYAMSFAAKRLVESKVTHTIADGLACRIPNPEALSIVLSGASRIVVVEEAEIRSAMRILYSDTHNVAEGAGAASLAAAIQERDKIRGLKIAAVLSGQNIDTNAFATSLLEKDSTSA